MLMMLSFALVRAFYFFYALIKKPEFEASF